MRLEAAGVTYCIGIDTGGTFTDAAALGSDGGIAFDKAFTTPDQPEEGVLDVLERVAACLGLTTRALLQSTTRFALGTTISTNALIQRRGAPTGLLTTAGFEDTLRIGRGPTRRTGGLDYLAARDFLRVEPPEPLVPPSWVRGLRERVAPDGHVLAPLDADETVAAIRELVAAGVQSLAVCLLWSFRHPEHERRVREIAATVAPGVHVSLSSEVAPQLGEFERAVTTVVDAYVGPVTRRAVDTLGGRLRDMGLGCPLHVMKSSGGLVQAAHLDGQAVAVVNSGPTGGLVAAQHMGKALGCRDLITTDMGGTSFDVGVVAAGVCERPGQPFLAQGVPVQVPALKVVTIGAGGGSIAWTDGHAIRVGPQSAGSVPGPSCYGRDGTEPTVTDALVVLGILDPDRFFGGRRRLNRDLAARAVTERVARPLGLGTVKAAAGIYDVVTARMSDLIRKASLESGHDPRGFGVLSYGGAGPAHCAIFARDLEAREAVVPFASSVFSALGIALSDIHFDYARSEPLDLRDEVRAAETFAMVFGELQRRARDDLEASGLDPRAATLTREVDLRYVGQMNEVSVPWGVSGLPPGGIAELRRRFEEEYSHRFGPGTMRPGAPLETMTFRLGAVSPTEKPRLDEAASRAPSEAPLPMGHRPVYLRGPGWVPAAIHAFDALPAGTALRGPALIERADTTILVPLGATARVDGLRNVHLTWEGTP